MSNDKTLALVIVVLFSLVSPSVGQTLISDELNVGGDASQIEEFREILSSAQILSEVGQTVDDTLTARIIFNLTIEYDSLANGSGDLGFSSFQMFSAGREAFAVGNWFQGRHWGGFLLGGVDSFPADFTFDTVNGAFAENDSESGIDLAVNEPRSIQLDFEYIAGADDILTVRFDGQEFVTVGSYEFDQLAVRSGQNGEQAADFTGMSITVISVPECKVDLVDLVDDFVTTQGQNGFSYLALGDGRPVNTTNSSSVIDLLTFDGNASLGNGSATFTGPFYRGPEGGFPYVQNETDRGYLALHPTATSSEPALAAAVGYEFSELGTFRVTGQFARANDFRLAGNGVDIGIYLNEDFSNPVFESTISSDHAVDPDDPFSGTGAVSFDEVIQVEIGDRLTFVVFADAQGLDAGFDVTALRGQIAPEPLVDLVDDFVTTQGQNGFSYLALGDGRPVNTTNSSSVIDLLTFDGNASLGNGSATFTGPFYRGPEGGFPYVQNETDRGYLALHPTATSSEPALAAAVGYEFSELGTFRVTGQFARANDFRLAGNGVDIGIYLNEDFSNPVFESTISSDHAVDPDDPFCGTGSISFDEVIQVEIGDRLTFAVFADAQGLDAGFDVTALRGQIIPDPVPGDFNRDGDVDADDIDFYSGNLGQPASFNTELDLNNDGTITLDDHDLHVTTLVETFNGETGALLGDINLDGSVNVLGDAFILVANLGNAGPFGYTAGDLNADGMVNVLGDAFRLVANLGLSNDR